MSGAIAPTFAANREETGAVQNLPLMEEKKAFTWRLTQPKKALRPLDETPANGCPRNASERTTQIKCVRGHRIAASDVKGQWCSTGTTLCSRSLASASGDAARSVRTGSKLGANHRVPGLRVFGRVLVVLVRIEHQ